MPRIFPDVLAENRAICISGTGVKSGFSVLMADTLPNYDSIEKSQCFPLYLYNDAEEVREPQQAALFNSSIDPECRRCDALTDEGLAHFQSAYPGQSIGKEDIFYYVYGLLHSSEYREKYADNLSKELPRISCVKTAEGF